LGASENPTPERLPVVCRRARLDDTTDVLKLTSQIWEGDDYVPQVWQNWLDDPDGALLVAEHAGRVIGLAKLSRLTAQDWWLQGLRVDPEFEGRGVASQLHRSMLAEWESIGAGYLRLATASFRKPVQHLCEQSGFAKVDEFTPFKAESLSSSEEPGFSPVGIGELDQALGFALASETLGISRGHIDLGWEWLPLRQINLVEMISEGRCWWWRGRQGMLATFEDVEGGREPARMMHFAACRLAALAAMLADFRRLAAAQGYFQVGWIASLNPKLVEGLLAAGFHRDWDASMYVYEKKLGTGAGDL
jgi:GNAT superfamily N-acetyltransferase